MNDSLIASTADDAQIDRLDELLSLLLDDCLDEAQVAELNDLLIADPSARERSLDTARLHADLLTFFRGTPGVTEIAEKVLAESVG